MRLPRLFVTVLGVVLAGPAAAAPVTVAVASNFSRTAEELGRQYTESTHNEVVFISGASGKLYAQIENGAPFDVLLSADADRPRQLEEKGLAVAGSRFTYAYGRLVLWSANPSLKGKDCRKALTDIEFKHVAIANPKTAPYGVAAVAVLEKLNLGPAKLGVLLVQGENIAQTLQFVASGSAQLGFVALSQLRGGEAPVGTCEWEVPTSFHEPIEQQAVLLKRAGANAAAAGFLDFLRRDASRKVIADQGYGLTP